MCVCIFQEMVVLCLVPFVKACCLSQRTALHPYFTALVPTINYPSLHATLYSHLLLQLAWAYPVSNSWLMHYRYRLRLLPSFRTPVSVRLVCVFTVFSSSFIIHAPLLLGHVQPKCLGAVFSLLVSETLRCMRSELLQITDHPNGTIKL